MFTSLLTICFAKINLPSFSSLFVSVNNGIPIWFRCFKGKHNSDAYSLDLIKQGISFCANLFSKYNYKVIFLADRWFPHIPILSHIEDCGCFYCIRCKTHFRCFYYDCYGNLVNKHLRDISPWKDKAKVVPNILFTRKKFKTNLVISRSCVTGESWYLITNCDTSRAVRHYSYRFGGIECVFKNQKSAGFRLESTNTQKIEHFISLFTIMCVALTWLVVIGSDYSKNKHHYHLKIRDTRKHKDNSTSRLYSLFNLGLTIFNKCYYNSIDFTLKFTFILYDQ